MAASNEEAKKKDVWKLTEKKIKRLKGVYIKAKKKINEVWKQDE